MSSYKSENPEGVTYEVRPCYEEKGEGGHVVSGDIGDNKPEFWGLYKRGFDNLGMHISDHPDEAQAQEDKALLEAMRDNMRIIKRCAWTVMNLHTKELTGYSSGAPGFAVNRQHALTSPAVLRWLDGSPGKVFAEPLPETNFVQEHMGHPDDSMRKLRELAQRYANETEAFDRRVCTGPMCNGDIMPKGSREIMEINRFANTLRKELGDEAARLGFTPKDWQRAIWESRHTLDENNPQTG